MSGSLRLEGLHRGAKCLKLESDMTNPQDKMQPRKIPITVLTGYVGAGNP
jgi:hypothetical protein